MKPSELLAAAIKGDTRAAEELGIYLDAMQRIAGESQFNSYVSQINTGVTDFSSPSYPTVRTTRLTSSINTANNALQIKSTTSGDSSTVRP